MQWKPGPRMILGISIALLALGLLYWAHRQDVFVRVWFDRTAGNGVHVRGVAVTPKPATPRPVALYIRGPGHDIMNDGASLRRIAELGLTAVTFSWTDRQPQALDQAVETVLAYLDTQPWSGGGGMAWIAVGIDARELLAFAEAHPERRPRVIIQQGGPTWASADVNDAAKRVPIVFVSDPDSLRASAAELPPSVATLLEHGFEASWVSIPDAVSQVGASEGLIDRKIAEACFMRVSPARGSRWSGSVAEWETTAPPWWACCLPAIGCFTYWLFQTARATSSTRPPLRPSRLREPVYWVAIALGAITLIDGVAHVTLPRLSTNRFSVAAANAVLITPARRADLAYLESELRGQSLPLSCLLEHVTLGRNTKELVPERYDDVTFREYVLSPLIDGERPEFGWRRSLWEFFTPRIRGLSTRDAAAATLYHLRSRVSVIDEPGQPASVTDAWRAQHTDERGFERLYIAALRSIGLPARRGPQGDVQLLNTGAWEAAPRMARSLLLAR